VPASAAKASLLCLVFTDLVDSTALKSRIGDASAGELLARYHEQVLRLVAANGGREIDSAGDGFFLTFEAPSAAVTFALQLCLLHEREPELPAVRVGAHLGEVTERPAPPGSSKPTLVEGLAVDLAARVCGLAGASQVLLTHPVFNAGRQRLMAEDLDREPRWHTHGPYRLKGIDDPVEIGEVGFEGLSPLAAPPDSEKARRDVSSDDELTLGWRPAPGLGIPGLPNWKLEEPLGRGAMGEVWLAAHEGTHARRVFKFCFQPDSLRSLKREVALLRLLKESLGERPDIAQVIDWQFERPPYFLEMEHTGAGDLVEWARQQGGIDKVELETRLDIVAQVADALAAAHGAGVLHKDLKPANVLIREDAQGRPRVCLTDFGIGLLDSREAHDVPGITVAGLTEALASTGATGGGTRLYMAPEVTEGREATRLSDVYSLGVMLFQVVAGDFRRALASGWEREIDDERLREDIAACVDGEPARRLAGPAELARRLRALPERRAAAGRARQRRRLVIGGLSLAAVAVVAVIGVRLFQLWSKAQWAREVAVPEIIELAGRENYATAFALASEVERELGPNPAFEPLWGAVSTQVDFRTQPPGATVRYKGYANPDGAWTTLGTTPIEQARVPLGPLRWQVELDGYETRVVAFRAPSISRNSPFARTPELVLDPAGTTPEGMLPVEGGRIRGVPLAGLPALNPEFKLELERFYIDRTEVTNAAYQEFVDAGGYGRREFWKHTFVKDGRTLPFEEAMSLFVDSTGRPGPATWVLGEHPEGQEGYPVSGISWYEAAAYAEFRNKRLPTLYHWVAAALPDAELLEPLGPAIVPLANLAGEQLEPVASRPGIGVAGAYDMAGNVAEWVSSERGDRRYLLGGSWTDPGYFFTQSSTESPWERRAGYGVRLASFPNGEPSEALLAPVEIAVQDFASTEPYSDEVFATLRELAAYDPTPLNAASESWLELPGGLRAEQVTLDAAYAGERLIVYLIPPEDAAPPYQAVLWMYGANMLYQRDTQQAVENASRFLSFVPKSGRLLVLPVYAGTFERNDERTRHFFSQYNSRRDLIRQWVQDIGRTLDYLAERDDVDATRVAYMGVSLGAVVGPIVASYEDRIAALLLWSGGFPAATQPREAVDLVSAARRTRVPVLMLNGRYDFVFPLEPHQTQFYEMLGSPEGSKRHVVYEAGHFPFPFGDMIRENLAWLDRHLGPVTSTDVAHETR
jgi:class 3 adenylate cyclase/formylglycine-generating enzyme required for sulfatase activity/dienelactone hydrolase